MFEQFETVAKPVITNGEKGEGGEGEQGAQEEPFSGCLTVLSDLVKYGASKKDKGESFERPGHGKSGIGDVRRVQAHRSKVFLKLGKTVASHPQEMGATNHLVDQVEQPENRPVDQDGKAHKLMGNDGPEVWRFSHGVFCACSSYLWERIDGGVIFVVPNKTTGRRGAAGCRFPG